MRLGQSGLTVCVLALLLLAGCQVGGSGITEREGYFSWVDEQGRVRYSRIPEAQHQGAVKGEQIVAPVSASDEIVEPEDDRAHSESARGAAAKLEENLEYTTENYPDGEELAKKGFIRPGQRQPYFTWRDANGIVRVSYYTPDMRTEEQKQAAQAPVILSDATVYLPAAVNGHTPVEGYDPDAFAILGVEDTATFFSVFAETCCQTLPARDFQEWQKDREFGVRFDDDTPRHSFSTGDSPYRLISLPSSTFVPGLLCDFAPMPIMGCWYQVWLFSIETLSRADCDGYCHEL